MRVTDVVFVPAAPLLVPVVAGGSARLDAEMREASLEVVAGAVADSVRVVVVTACEPSGEWTEAATWDFAGFGVPRLGADHLDALPWQLGVGAWLLDETGWEGPRRYVGLPVEVVADPADGPADDPADAARVTVIVVGDGSACRTEKAPGYLDGRAEAFDAAVESALRDGDATGLMSLDQATADDLLCRSLPAWRWVVAAAAGAAVVDARVSFAAAPYGVAYFVARWRLERLD